MDRLALPLTLGHIAGTRPGAALVVGGGMHAPADLDSLGGTEFGTVLSANAHAFRLPLKPDFIVCKDHLHTQTKRRMEPELRQHPAPIISRHWWADYRIMEWPFQGNSGIMAIGVAAILGCSPIYTIGFDFYQEGTYWYDPTAKNVSSRTRVEQHLHKAKTMMEGLGNPEIRPVSGPLVALSGTSYVGTDQGVRTHRYTPAFYVRALQPTALPFSAGAGILPGREFWVTQKEYTNARVRHYVRVLDKYTPV